MKKTTMSLFFLFSFFYLSHAYAQLTNEEKYFNAAFTGDLKTLKQSLNMGVDINARDVSKQTALMLASKQGKFNIVRFLVETGADIHATSSGYSALTFAAIHGHFQIAKYLIDHGVKIDNNALLYAASVDYQTLKYMLEKGANAKFVGPGGMTLLMYASGNGKLQSVKLLVEKGVNVNAKNNQGMTALDFALKNKHSDIVSFLKKYMR